MKCYKLPQHPRAVFSSHLDVCKLSVYMIDPIIFLITGFFNSTKWRNKLLVQNINFTGHKTCMLPTTLDFPEDMSHRHILVLVIQGFS